MDNLKQVYYAVYDWIRDHKKFSGAVLLVVIGFVLAKVL